MVQSNSVRIRTAMFLTSPIRLRGARDRRVVVIMRRYDKGDAAILVALGSVFVEVIKSLTDIA
jgi:hypothetical protein